MHSLALHRVVLESLCLGLDNIAIGKSDRLTLDLLATGAISVYDNGPGLPVEPKNEGGIRARDIFTNIYACRSAKKSRHRDSLCQAGIVVVNVLSCWLTYEVQNERLWTQRFEGGEPLPAVSAPAQGADVWQRMTYLPNPELFDSPRLDLDFIRDTVLRETSDCSWPAFTFQVNNRQ